MANVIPPLSPRTQMRNLIVEMCEHRDRVRSLLNRVEDVVDQIIDAKDVPAIHPDTIDVFMTSLEQLQKNRYNGILGAMNSIYSFIGGDIESLANALFGEEPSPQRDDFIARQQSIQARLFPNR